MAIVGFWDKKKYFPIIPKEEKVILASTVRIAAGSGIDAESLVRGSSIELYANPIDKDTSFRFDNAMSGNEMRENRRVKIGNKERRRSR